jgi:hypothetical protein
MPTTARLLEKLRETLGEEPTRDLLALIGEAREVNRAEIREIADLYLSRLDERIARHLVEHDAKIDAKIERRFAEQNKHIDRRFADAKIDQRFSALEARMDAGFAAVRVEMADRLSAQYRDLMRWLFVFWAGTIIPLAGLMVALIKL